MSSPEQVSREIQKELDRLDQEWVHAGGTTLKACHCYHFEKNPPHFLFNTNCPDDLRSRLNEILAKYTGENESSSRH